MMDNCSTESKKLNPISDMNSNSNFNIVEKRILEKVHILPIKKNVSNLDPLYTKLNSLIIEKCVLYEGFVISLKNDYSGEDAKEGTSEDQYKNVNKNDDDNKFLLEKNIIEVKEVCKIAHNNKIRPYEDKSDKLDDNMKDIQLNNQTDYVIIDCIPSKGVLSHDTLIYTEGKYVDNLKKVNILIINDQNYKKYEKKIKNKSFSFKKYFLKKSSQFFNEAISFIPFSIECYSKKSKKKNESNILRINKEQKKMKKDQILNKILNSYFYPYFKKNKHKLFYCGKLFIINNFSFLILEVDSDVNVGFVNNQTEIILNVDCYEQFNNVHIVPLHDTLPTTYNYDLFVDYIKPYIEKHYLNLYSIYDTFFYKGVQFKIMGIDPVNVKYGRARISCNTFIYMEGSIKPTFFDVISKDAINYIKCFPFEYKPYAILNILHQLDSDSLLRLFPSVNINLHDNNKKEENVLKHLTKYKYIFSNKFKNNNVKSLEDHNKDPENVIKNKNDSSILKNYIIEQCAVCFEHFKDHDKCIKLTCFHTYHWKCVKNWFKFNLTCPCCRSQLKF